jgi:CSLREA domain-containing protein
MPNTSALRTTRLILISLILLLSALAGAEVLASPQDTEIVVNTPTDELNSNGNCSLREALRAANLDAAVDACPAGSGIDTIILPMGTYTMTVAGSNENEGLTGDLDINSSLSILGSGRQDTIIDGNNLDRVFHITGEYIVKIGGVTIQYGKAALGEPTEYGGGGILNGTQGDLTLSRIILTSNWADYTGGGLDNAGSATLVDVTISSNLAESGGGVYSSGNIYLRGVTFSENTATLSGGGFDNSKFATLTNVTFSGNAAPVGGGIRNDSELTLINTTLYANSTAITNELSGNVDFYNTLVAGSTEGDNCTIVGTSRSVYNLDSGDTCNFDGANDIINTDPLLGPLADNKGPTWTHAFLEGSPAIDHGDNSDCPDIDQRGASRPADGDDNDSRICDIGAYEHNGAFPNLMYLPLTSR